MDITDIEDTLVQIHQEIQDKKPDSTKVQVSTRPLRDLPGFDSLLVPVAFRRLARKLGIQLPPDYRVPNLYVNPTTRQRLSIAEIAGEFYQRFGAKAA